jgi:hypothetical protein
MSDVTAVDGVFDDESLDLLLDEQPTNATATVAAATTDSARVRAVGRMRVPFGTGIYVSFEAVPRSG